jgi:hypothetical protein
MEVAADTLAEAAMVEAVAVAMAAAKVAMARAAATVSKVVEVRAYTRRMKNIQANSDKASPAAGAVATGAKAAEEVVMAASSKAATAVSINSLRLHRHFR